VDRADKRYVNNLEDADFDKKETKNTLKALRGCWSDCADDRVKCRFPSAPGCFTFPHSCLSGRTS
jgi:hypothetical protein